MPISGPPKLQPWTQPGGTGGEGTALAGGGIQAPQVAPRREKISEVIGRLSGGVLNNTPGVPAPPATVPITAPAPAGAPGAPRTSPSTGGSVSVNQGQPGMSSPSAAPPAYPTTPLPLSGNDIAQFEARRRQATRQLQEALANRTFEGQRITAGFDQFKARLEREAEKRSTDMRYELGGRGMALQPRGAGRGLRTIRDWHADTVATEQHSVADRMAALEEAVRRARQYRDEEHAAIGADEARSRTDLDRLIRSVGA